MHPCNISRNQENIMRWFFINDEVLYKCCETFLIICKTQDSWMNSPAKVRVINSNEICKLLAYTETNFILSLYTHRGNKYVVYIFNCCYEVENEIAFKNLILIIFQRHSNHSFYDNCFRLDIRFYDMNLLIYYII